MNKELLELLNIQIQKEFESAYIYLGIASFFDEFGLTGFSKWYKKQAQEEQGHAMKIFDYLHDENQDITLLPINAPKRKIENAEQALELSLEHEKFVTSFINNLYYEAEKIKDYRTQNFLEWFIDEQKEEESQAQTMIAKFNLFGNTPAGLYALDREFGKRA